MTKSSPSQPRGISEIVSYVLLVVIAVSISVLVYNFISVYIPKEKATCPADVFLGAQSISCSFGTCEQIDPNIEVICSDYTAQTKSVCQALGCNEYKEDSNGGPGDCAGTHTPCNTLSQTACNKDYACTWQPAANDEAKLSLTLINKGLFTVDAAYIRVGKQGKEVTFLINEPKEGGSARGFYLYESGSTTLGLPPGKEVSYAYQVPLSIIDRAGTYTLEIEPAVGRGTNMALCEASVSRQEFTCA